MRGLSVILMMLAAPVYAEALVPPSGLRAKLVETLYEPVGVPAARAQTLRLRFVAPQIADEEAFGFARIEADFEWFCASSALPLIAQSAPEVENVIVSIASEPIDFGETAPNVVQYFDAFAVRDAACIWEGL